MVLGNKDPPEDCLQKDRWKGRCDSVWLSQKSCFTIIFLQSIFCFWILLESFNPIFILDIVCRLAVQVSNHSDTYCLPCQRRLSSLHHQPLGLSGDDCRYGLAQDIAMGFKPMNTSFGCPACRQNFYTVLHLILGSTMYYTLLGIFVDI